MSSVLATLGLAADIVNKAYPLQSRPLPSVDCFFKSKGPMGPKSSLGSDMCLRILHWLSFSRYIEAIWWHSIPGLFLPPLLIWYVDSESCNLIMQRSLLSRQASYSIIYREYFLESRHLIDFKQTTRLSPSHTQPVTQSATFLRPWSRVVAYRL